MTSPGLGLHLSPGESLPARIEAMKMSLVEIELAIIIVFLAFIAF